jgi:hypothetical protein
LQKYGIFVVTGINQNKKNCMKVTAGFSTPNVQA